MEKSVQIKKRYPLGEGFTYLDQTFTFRYLDTEFGISSEDDIEESTYWTKEEVLEILNQQPVDHPAFVAFISIDLNLIEDASDVASYGDNSHLCTPRSVSPQESMEIRSTKEVLNTNSFFTTKRQAMGASVMLFDSIFVLGLAIAGLLSMQHLTLIMFGLAATSAIAAAGSYHYTPQLN